VVHTRGPLPFRCPQANRLYGGGQGSLLCTFETVSQEHAAHAGADDWNRQRRDGKRAGGKNSGLLLK
ncbi:MAG TPA: hypothetical protein VJ734_09255, partial [Nitrosospira sp.]|nr:hypothetical protein [Nitrosospira sp.]